VTPTIKEVNDACDVLEFNFRMLTQSKVSWCDLDLSFRCVVALSAALGCPSQTAYCSPVAKARFALNRLEKQLHRMSPSDKRLRVGLETLRFLLEDVRNETRALAHGDISLARPIAPLIRRGKKLG